MFADIYLFKLSNGNTRTFSDIYPKVQRHIYNPVKDLSFPLLTIFAKKASSEMFE